LKLRTYHHSILPLFGGTAAESIAQTLLAKVGAYYHDIGKMKKPLYFIETREERNKHDNFLQYEQPYYYLPR
jgi:putative nucleotidyltransferase with HDIG domain